MSNAGVVLFLLGFAYAIFCGFTGVYIATQKGRSQGEGMFFGLLFGPLGLVVAASLPNVLVEGGSVESADDQADEEEQSVRAHLDAIPPSAGDPVNRFLDGMERRARVARDPSRPDSPPPVPGTGRPRVGL